MNCSNCEFAYKSGNEDFVFCTFWQEQANKSKMEVEKFIKSVMFSNEKPKQVATGWVYPNQHYKAKGNAVINGTVTEGLMWNNQICIPKEDTCNHFKELK